MTHPFKFAVAATIAIVAMHAAGSALADESITAKEEAALRAAANHVANSVVQIRTIGGLDSVEGTVLADGPTTGLVISSDGYIVSSAFNFIQEPASILVTLPGGKQAPAELVATDHSRMIVLLKVTGIADLPVPSLTPATEAKPGQWAIAVGRTFRADQVNVAVGIVSAVGRMHGKAIQTDASVSTANYGGPLVDIRGRVLGLIVPMAPQATSEVAGAEWYDSGIGFAVPLEPLAARIEHMKKGNDLKPGLLGVGLANRNPHAALAALSTVRPDSPAGQAGLKKGDRIITINGKPIRSQTDMRFALAPLYAGDVVRVRVKRGDDELEREIKLVGELSQFRHAFLGVLPMRPAANVTTVADEDDATSGDSTNDPNAKDGQTGVVVRMVYAGSPAEEVGILPNDRIDQINDTPIKSAADAMDTLNNVAPGVELKVNLFRNNEPLELTTKATRMSASVPSDLPAAYTISVDDAIAEKPTEPKPGETRPLKLPEFPNECAVYIPASHETGQLQAVVICIQPPGDWKPEDVVDQWRAICDRDGILLVVPKPANNDRWERTEIEYLRRLSERVLGDFKIDPHRCVVFGRAAGGSMAWLLGLASRDIFSGIATSAAPLPRQVKPPANDPSLRFAIFAALPAAKDEAAQVSRGLEQLQEAGYPVTTTAAVEKSGQMTDTQLNELARWIDTLDRF